MRGLSVGLAVLLMLGCDSSTTGDGGTGMDGGVTPLPDGSTRDAGSGRRDVGPDGCVVRVEICGDRMDQNCDGRDQSCGDNDGDLWQACTVDDVDLTMCDCDDTRSDVYPPGGPEVPGAAEACDGVDNDCNGRVDDAPACCSGCSGIDPTRADTCTEAGACECSTDGGSGPCAEGSTCCSSGCVNTQTDARHCGSCRGCGDQADTCMGGMCSCGSTGSICDFTDCCVGGACVARSGSTCPST